MEQLSTVTSKHGDILGALSRRGKSYFMKTFISGETIITPGTAGLEFEMRKVSMAEDQKEAHDMMQDLKIVAQLFRDSREPELLKTLVKYNDFLYQETGIKFEGVKT